MPIFEFACEKCEHSFEVLVQKAGQEKQAQCPKCESKRLKKQFSAFGVSSGGAKPSSCANSSPPSSGPCMPRGCGCH